MRVTSFLFLLLSSFVGKSQNNGNSLPIADKITESNIRSSELTTQYISPKKIIWRSDTTGKYIKNSEKIMLSKTGQADLTKGEFLTLKNEDQIKSGIVLDFGKEIQGGLEIITARVNRNPAGKIRIRFGESVAETMSDLGQHNATNDHAMRDFYVTLPRIGSITVGESGFRFVRIDLEDPNATLQIKEISAIFRFRDIPYLGSFKSNDKRLNDIWQTGAYTVHLNMQNYLWDGIKRDRLVWVGDLHPEVMTINAVFGQNDIVTKSLDFARDEAPLPRYMNGIGSYSIWWILIHRDLYQYQGNISYLREQHNYLKGLLLLLSTKIGENGAEVLDGERFLDWPSSDNKPAIHAGLQALMLMGFEAGAELSDILGDVATKTVCEKAIAKLRLHQPDMANSKQAAALLSMAGLVQPETANNEVLAKDGVHKMSPFYGYYMLIAQAKANDYTTALNTIRNYWGAMLDFGATTFWEDFNIDWTINAAPIDELVPKGKIDIHGNYGGYAYKGFRHSLCHGWASGPTPWLTKYILGINISEAGCKKITIEPHLGDLEWVEGSFPTPYGLLKIKHQKQKNGTIKTTYKKPKGIKIIVK